jgi:hypothetical protein
MVSAKELHPDEHLGGDELCWHCLLAEVVRVGRYESVGGTLHPRPTVAAP